MNYTATMCEITIHASKDSVYSKLLKCWPLANIGVQNLTINNIGKVVKSLNFKNSKATKCEITLQALKNVNSKLLKPDQYLGPKKSQKSSI